MDYSDIQPLPLTPEGITVSTILYSEDYKQSLGLLRALQSRKEYSERALHLTEQVIGLNAAHYTVWQYRFHNIIQLGKSIKDELEWVEEIAIENVKNYQIWHYRQLLLEKLGTKDPKSEFPLIEIMLDDDSKNYHVWSFRKWVVQWSGVWDDELEFSDRFITADVYNNSAWCHRFFALFKGDNNNTKSISDDEFNKELEYVLNKIELAPQNVSPWNYIVGIIEKLGKPLDLLKPTVLKYTTNTSASSNVELSIPAFKILVKINSKENIPEAIIGYDLLATKYDTIRSNYWLHQKSLINQL